MRTLFGRDQWQAINGTPMVRGIVYSWRIVFHNSKRIAYSISIGTFSKVLNVLYIEDTQKLVIGEITDDGINNAITFFCDDLEDAERFVTSLSIGNRLPVMPLYVERR